MEGTESLEAEVLSWADSSVAALASPLGVAFVSVDEEYSGLATAGRLDGGPSRSSWELVSEGLLAGPDASAEEVPPPADDATEGVAARADADCDVIALPVVAEAEADGPDAEDNAAAELGAVLEDAPAEALGEPPVDGKVADGIAGPAPEAPDGSADE